MGPSPGPALAQPWPSPGPALAQPWPSPGLALAQPWPSRRHTIPSPDRVGQQATQWLKPWLTLRLQLRRGCSGPLSICLCGIMCGGLAAASCAEGWLGVAAPTGETVGEATVGSWQVGGWGEGLMFIIVSYIYYLRIHSYLLYTTASRAQTASVTDAGIMLLLLCCTDAVGQGRDPQRGGGVSTHKEAARNRKQGWLTLGSSHAPPNYCYTYRYSAKREIFDRHKRLGRDVP